MRYSYKMAIEQGLNNLEGEREALPRSCQRTPRTRQLRC